jgi:RNA polymerase sigma factor (TIGR02999 family)
VEQPEGLVTQLIHRALSGDSAAADQLFDVTYPELRRLARSRLRAGGRDALLDTVSLVHESYLRFVGSGEARIEDRAHFMRWAGRVMRSVIVDFARKRSAEKRGGDVVHVSFTVSLGDRTPGGADEILRIHEALGDLARLDTRMAQVVEMRYFAGMTEPEIGIALGVTERTVRRDWEKARLFLREALA